MSDTLLIAIVVTIPGVIAAVSAWRTAHKVEQVHRATNSMKDELVKATEAAARAAGYAERVLEEKMKRRRKRAG